MKKAIYSQLKDLHVNLSLLEGEYKILQEKLNHIYKISSDEVQSFMDDHLEHDDVEFFIYEAQEDLNAYEKKLEHLYNDWKFSHYHDELFTKMDNSIFAVSYINVGE